MAFRGAVKVVAFATLNVCVAAFESEIISDLTISSTDEKRALEIKNQDFWQPVLSSAEAAKMASAYVHLSVYEEVETAIYTLPAENAHVHKLLTDALSRLKRADRTVFKQALESSEIASEQLVARPRNVGFSFLTGGQNYFVQAIRNFVGFGRYSEQAGQQVQQRLAEVTPVLRGAAAATGDVLSDCREGSKLAFDVLKYDIYTDGVPKTPEIAKVAAYSLVDAIGETRHNFMRGITDAAKGITRDIEAKDSDPSTIVTKSLSLDLNEHALANQGERNILRF